MIDKKKKKKGGAIGSSRPASGGDSPQPDVEQLEKERWRSEGGSQTSDTQSPRGAKGRPGKYAASPPARPESQGQDRGGFKDENREESNYRSQADGSASPAPARFGNRKVAPKNSSRTGSAKNRM